MYFLFCFSLFLWSLFLELALVDQAGLKLLEIRLCLPDVELVPSNAFILVLWAPCSQYCMEKLQCAALVCHASSTQELEIQGSGDHLQQHSKCEPSWWETDPLKKSIK